MRALPLALTMSICAAPFSANAELDKPYADKTLAEAMAFLARDADCGDWAPKGSIDWPSFEAHVDKLGNSSIGGNCDLTGEIRGFCSDHTSAPLMRFKNYVCSYKPSGDEEFTRRGFEVKYEGDTFHLYTNLQRGTLNLAEVVEETLPSIGSDERGGFKVEVDKKHHDETLVEGMASMGREDNCGFVLESSIDWKSFKTPYHKSPDGRAMQSIGGYCDIGSELGSYCAKHGKKALARFKKFRCVYREKGNARYMQQYWGHELKAEGDTLILFTNMLGTNLYLHLDEMMKTLRRSPARRR